MGGDTLKENQYILSLSYGKDSLACLEAIKLLGLPLDRIIHAEIWATDTIPADLPPMVEFKKKADKIIKERYGITVEHITAVERERESCHTKNNSTNYGLTRKSTGSVSTVSQCYVGHGVIPDLKEMSLTMPQKRTYEKLFYLIPKRQYQNILLNGRITGFPYQKRPWCSSRLKERVIDPF